MADQSLVSRIRSGVGTVEDAVSKLGSVIQNGRLEIRFSLPPGQRFVVALLVGILVGIFLALLGLIASGTGPFQRVFQPWVLFIITIVVIGIIYWLLG